MRKATIKKPLLLLLAAAMTLGYASACAGNDTATDTEQTEQASTPLTETEGESSPETDISTDGETSVETEPQTPPDDPEDPASKQLVLAENGQTAYTLILPDFAAAWETDAADDLVALFAATGVTLPVAKDADAEVGTHEIVVGYTNRQDVLPEGFFDVGENGYHILVSEKKLYVGANTEEGMKAALERLKADLTVSDGSVSIFESYVCKAVDEGNETTDITLTGTFAESVKQAQMLKDGVQAGYTNGNREGFTMTNLNMAATADLTGKGNKLIASLVNENGVPYLRDTMDIYAMVGDGTIFYGSDSSMNGRVNIYRYGTYYYETHILGTNFGQSFELDESVESYDILSKVKKLSGNQLEDIKLDDGRISYTVSSSNDPYLNISTALSVPTSQYNALLLTMRTEDATSAQLYFAAGNKSAIDGSQMVSFVVYPGEEFITYIVRLDSVEDYTGMLRHLRLDCGATAGEKVEITELKAVHVTDVPVPAIAVDRTLHTYSDKLNQVVNLVMTDVVDDLSAYGMKTVIDASRVKGLIVVDKNGEHRDTLEGIDWNSVTCVGFDIERAGVFGYIMTTHDASGKITVTLKDGQYIIDQKVDALASYSAEQKVSFGHRVYTDSTHDFAGLLDAHNEEQNPLQNITLTAEGDNARVLGYDPLRGAYGFDINGMDFNQAYYQRPDKHYTINAQVTGDSNDRTVYVYGHTLYGNLESSVVLDENKNLLPLAVQVCKNFQGENEEPLFDKGDTSYGEAYFPLVVKANETLQFSILHLYQNWGKHPLKQISSIQFIAPYYHLSTGATETNCIAPYYVYGKDRWTLPDFRAMSAPLWAGQPQHTSAGRLYFLEYITAEGEEVYSESTVDIVDAYGPTYSDIWMTYISDDGKIKVDYRHMEMPQTDENRTYYEIRMTVLEDIEIENFKDDFSFFSMDGRAVTYETVSYLDENNRPVITDPNLRETRPDYHKLGMESPFFAYSYCSTSNDYVNMAVIVKDWDITIGGEKYTDHLVFRDAAAGGLNDGALTLNLEKVTLKAGDSININMILLPWGSQKTAETDISNVLQVRQDSCLTPFKAEVTTGTLIFDTYMPKINAENNTAEFTVSGGHNNMAVRVYGFDNWQAPTIEEKVNGQWVTYDVASVNGYDGYMVFYDGDGTYSYAFIIPMDNGEARTFRITA